MLRIQLSHTCVELVHELLLLEQIFSVSPRSCRYVVGKGSEMNVYSMRVRTGPRRVGSQLSFFSRDADGGADIVLKNFPSEASPKCRSGLSINPHTRSYASVSHRVSKGVYQNPYRVLAIGRLGQVALTPVPNVGPAKPRRAPSKQCGPVLQGSAARRERRKICVSWAIPGPRSRGRETNINVLREPGKAIQNELLRKPAGLVWKSPMWRSLQRCTSLAV